MKKYLILIAALPFVFFACKKDEEKKSGYEMLTNGTWKITEVYIAKDGTVALDYYSTLLTCAKDNFYSFNKDNSITSNEGATKCDDTVKQVTTDGTWVLSNGDKIFTIKDSKILPISGDQVMNVVTIEDNLLKLSKDTTINYPGIGVISGTINATFRKN